MPSDDGDPQSHDKVHRTGFSTPEDLSEAAVLKHSYAELQKEYEALKARSSKEKKKRLVKALGRNVEYECQTHQAHSGTLTDDSDDNDKLKRRTFSYMSKNEAALADLGHRFPTQLEAGAKSSCGNDINSLKRMAGDILNQQSPSQHLNPDSRKGQGLQVFRPLLLLAPLTFVSTGHGRNTHRVHTKLYNMELDINSSFFIRFLYCNKDGDLEEAEKGFLYSDWIVRGLHYVFTSSSSAKALNIDHSHSDMENQDPQPRASKRPKKKATKQTVAQLIGMTEVSPCAIAYIAVLLLANRLQLIRLFCVSVFYNAIVDYFKIPKPNTPKYTHTHKILSWYTKNHGICEVITSIIVKLN
ncbi:hypothetical protein BDN71DRAFT_1431240 [Pleurotus eryngii]|uniref:Uncharacterized protein n=1 Tax=Pleurotus eryngii TaxID=5323 RepID=A0A9P5ZZI4_PLEER|nr:hypothetical protein BDN71DRAFT_1431240 [Pleurotus eryngii]